MKKTYLTLCFLICTIFCFADDENICVITNTGSSGQACSASSLGFVNPCSTLGFVVNYQIPADFLIVAKYEWFVNGVSVKTTTTPSDPVLSWQIKAATTNVLCKVTYKKQDGTLSQVYTSTTFTPNVKILNFSSIVAVTTPPNYGCTTNPVSYSLNTYTCSGPLCSGVFNANTTQYQISWQPPSGWTQTSISPNGNNVSFLPDANTGGTLTATITLSCGFTETRTFTVNRVAATPVFSSSNNSTICTSSASLAINPSCGAVNYTYTIVGNAGITFSSNGLQTLTTSSTSASLILSGANSSFVFKAKANYPGNNVSGEASTTINNGAPSPPSISHYNYDAQCGTFFEAYSTRPTGTDSYLWNLNFGQVVQENSGYYGNYFYTAPLINNPIPGQYYYNYLTVQVRNTCGLSAPSETLQFTVGPIASNCDGGGGGPILLRVSPNPTSGGLMVESKDSKMFSQLKIIDRMGNMKKLISIAPTSRATININELPADIYRIQALINDNWRTATFIKQ